MTREQNIIQAIKEAKREINNDDLEETLREIYWLPKNTN